MSTMNVTMGKIVKAAWRPVAGLAGLVVMAMWLAGAFEHKVHPGKLDYAPGFALPADAKTLTVKTIKTASPVDVVGIAASERWVNLSARLPTTIQTMLVRAGDTVTNGQVLATLDDREIREQLAGAEAQCRQAETEYNRTMQLFEKGATTDQAKVAALTALEGARARLQQVRVMLSYATLTSPINGVVTDRRFEAGDLVAPGLILISVYDPQVMRFEAPVPVRLLDRFGLGQAVSVKMDGVSSPVKGVVSEIVGEVDPLSRTRKVKIKLAQSGDAVLPGAYGHLAVSGEAHDSIWVPATAVYRVGQQELVQVVRENRVTCRIVRTGMTREGEVEVIAGLADGEVILTEAIKEG